MKKTLSVELITTKKGTKMPVLKCMGLAISFDLATICAISGLNPVDILQITEPVIIVEF